MLVRNGSLLFGRELSVGVLFGDRISRCTYSNQSFLPALPREGYLETGTTTVAEGLGIFKDIVTADGEVSPARLAMAAGTTAAADDLCFKNVKTLKRYLINHLISRMLSGQCFVFLFRQGTE
jgi:hypothetical protein